MKLYDLSQPLNADVSFWPYYPPFEVKYIKRKSEHGVNAQYEMGRSRPSRISSRCRFVTGTSAVGIR